MLIDVIRDLNGLASLRDSWNQAVEASIFDSVFQTHEWFYSWAKVFSTPENMYVVVAYEDGKLVGVMPLKIERICSPVGTWTVLRSMTNTHTYKYSIIVSKERGVEVLDEMFKYINKDVPWTLMQLDHIPASTLCVPMLACLKGRGFFNIRVNIGMASPYVSMEGSWDSYFAGRDKRVRKNWQNFERRADREGSSRIVSICGGDGLEEDVHAAFEIERSSWKGVAGSAIAMSEAVSGFYLELARRMSQIGRFQLNFLSFNDEKIAFDYCLPYKDHYNVLKTGYNPSFSKNSPGRVLHIKVVRDLYDKGAFKVYDLLGSSDPWKKEWTDLAEPLVQVWLYNRRSDAMIAYGAVRSVDMAKDILRRYPPLRKAVKRAYYGLKSMYL